MLLSVASSSSAGIITITGSGVVGSNGYDPNGIFGPAGSSLVGDSFQLTYTHDTSLGIFNGSSFAGGGSNVGQPSLGGATLTINGVTVTYTGNYVDYLIGSTQGACCSNPYLQDAFVSDEATNSNSMRVDIASSQYPVWNITQPFTSPPGFFPPLSDNSPSGNFGYDGAIGLLLFTSYDLSVEGTFECNPSCVSSVPGPILGSGLPGLIFASGGLLASHVEQIAHPRAGVLVGTNRILALVTASQMASASAISFFCRLT
jgi:hypothetical protein